MERNELIGKYLNRYGYSDIKPVGKIIELVGKESVRVQKIEYGENKVKMNFIPGGFAAHCDNQNEQRYDFTETEEIVTVRLSKAYLKNVRIEESPCRYYDYNF